MEEYQQRVIDEKSELDTKLEKLYSFFNGSIYSNLVEEEKTRLNKQSKIMKEYSNILEERINTFV